MGAAATTLEIALHRTSELASWDEATLAKLLQELKTEDALDGVGYSVEDLEELLAGLDDGAPAGDRPSSGPSSALQKESRPGVILQRARRTVHGRARGGRSRELPSVTFAPGRRK